MRRMRTARELTRYEAERFQSFVGRQISRRIPAEIKSESPEQLLVILDMGGRSGS
jgi:hypothetical protein